MKPLCVVYIVFRKYEIKHLMLFRFSV